MIKNASGRALALLALVACAQPRTVTIEELLAPKMHEVALGAMGVGAERFALARPIYPRSGPQCAHDGMTPVMTCKTLPRIGRAMRVQWQLDIASPVRRTVDANGEEKPRAVSVLMSFGPLEEPYALAPGCWLLVRPEHVLVPGSTGALRYDAGAGVVTLDLVPALGLAGVSIYLQLLVAAPEANSIGHLLSAAIELTFGS